MSPFAVTFASVERGPVEPSWCLGMSRIVVAEVVGMAVAGVRLEVLGDRPRTDRVFVRFRAEDALVMGTPTIKLAVPRFRR